MLYCGEYGVINQAPVDSTLNWYQDIHAVFEKVKASGVEFLHTIHEEPWGQFTFRFFDPDRHLIEVGEFLETFVKRIYSETKSVEAVSAKTGVNAETIRKIVM